MRHALDGQSFALVMAVTFISYSHFISHFGIAVGYLIAMTRNNSIINKLMRVSWYTKVAGFGFFLFCGVTHIGLATHTSNSPIITLTDHLQLVCIYVFLLGLLYDSHRVVVRLGHAFENIISEYDGLAVVKGQLGSRLLAEGKAEKLLIGSNIVATVSFALHGQGDAPDSQEQGQAT